MTHPYQIFDVFTDTALTGNPLAIVYDADDLTTEAMARIAAEFNLSETVFFVTPDGAEHTARMRIFIPQHELPFAGHPTIGGAIAQALRSDRFGDAVTLELAAGLVSVAVEARANGGVAAFDAPIVPTLLDGDDDPSAVAAALGLEAACLGFGGLSVARATSGPEFTIVPINDAAALARIRLDRNLWPAAFQTDHGAVLVIAETGPGAFQARMFAPLAGIEEDPATGSAAVAFAALIGPHMAQSGTHAIEVVQGVEMGRPSRISVTLEMDEGTLCRVRLAGAAVKIADGTLFV